MSAGVVDLIYSNNLPVETRRLVDLVRKDIIDGTFKPFADEMYDQNGNKMNEKGNVIEPEDVITMDWFMDNVVGGMPDYDSLEDSAKVIVSQQGVMDLNDN